MASTQRDLYDDLTEALAQADAYSVRNALNGLLAHKGLPLMHRRDPSLSRVLKALAALGLRFSAALAPRIK